MPSLTTHYIFANMVLKKLNKEIQNTFDPIIYHAFSQSHDFLYYSFNKKLRRLGSIAHHRDTQAYLINIVKNIIDNKLQNNKECLGYLYGAITHYVLDTVCHPYIFYKTGTYYKDKPDHHKYKGQHTNIEKQLDAIYYKKYFNEDYYKINVTKKIIGNPHLSQTLIELINKVYLQTYNINNVGGGYKKSIFETKLITSLMVNDRFGIKYNLFSFINIFTHSHPEYYSAYLKKPNISFLNNEKKEWNHPCDINEKYNYSFDELLEISKDKCIKIIEQCNECIYKTKNIDTLKIYIPDLDYANGYLISNDKVMKYFEY